MCSALVSARGLTKRGKLHAKRTCFGSWIKERGIFMCRALVSAHGLKNEVNCTRSALVLAHRLMDEVYSCVGRLFRFMD